MAQIILTEEQARAIAEAKGPIDVLDPQGRPVASLELLDPADIEAVERFKRSRDRLEPGIPSGRVQEFLRKLHETADRGGLDQAKIDELLRRVRAGEAI